MSYAPLLLPVLPWLGGLAGAAGERGAEWPWLAVLAGIGAALTWGLPAVLDRAGCLLRKDVTVLRLAWLGSVLAVQVALLPVDEGGGLAVPLLVGSAVLMAAMPFGIEFLHRTLPGLLSQPVSRWEVWRIKMGVSGAALLLLWAVTMLSAAALGRPLPGGVPVGLLGIVAAAWGATPYWTLVTRSLLAGAVFSLAAPVLAVGIAALGILMAEGSPAQSERMWSGWMTAIGWGALLVYAGSATVATARRWRTMEAPDAGAGETAGVFLGAGRTPRSARRATAMRATGPDGFPGRLVTLAIKEVRLQTVTLATLGVMVLGWVMLRMLPSAGVAAQGFQGLVLLLAGMTMLLAGATAIAEERRLGTLEGQLLLPVSRAWQWRVKGVLALALGVPACFAVYGAVRNLVFPTPWVLTGLAIGAVPVALLVSSGAANALRALLGSLALIVLASVLAMGAFFLFAWGAEHGREWLWESLEKRPERWRVLAESLSPVPPDPSAIEPHPSPQWIRGIPLLAGIPILLALAMARRNFFCPAAAPLRWMRDGVGWLLGLTATCLLGVLLALGALGWWERGQVLNHVRLAIAFERTWSPAEARLREAMWGEFYRDLTQRLPNVQVPRSTLLYPSRSVPVLLRPASNPLDDPEPDARKEWGDGRRMFLLPLSAADRATIIERGELPEDLREALRGEMPSFQPRE